MLKYKDNVLQTIGDTPLIKLNKVVDDIPALVLAKVETYNPGHSIKDRMALKMVEDAEADGKLKPGGTIIECTSGNTGMGVALAGVVKGYKCIFTTSDKQSKEKIDILKAVGAEVIVCPTNVTPDDPRSYYSVAEKLSNEIPNSVWLNQYDNPSNAVAHYESTGPEIWEQTGGKITHFIVGVGTGGTISGTAKYLKEQNPDIKVWGVDTYGSVFKKYHETGVFDEKEIYPYITEGIGEDILPKNVDFSMAGLHQLKKELTADDVVVIIFHDHGSRYVGKVYNDEWMRQRGFLDDELKVKDIIAQKSDKRFISVQPTHSVRDVLQVMKQNDISQLPVVDGDDMIGSVSESKLLEFILSNPLANSDKAITEIMGDAFPKVELDTNAKDINRYIDKHTSAVVVTDQSGTKHIITQYDIIRAL